MTQLNLVLAIILLVAVVAAVRYQAHWVVSKVTSDSEAGKYALPVGTPVIGTICVTPAKKTCSFEAIEYYDPSKQKRPKSLSLPPTFVPVR
jgi:hypothetical protein